MEHQIFWYIKPKVIGVKLHQNLSSGELHSLVRMLNDLLSEAPFGPVHVVVDVGHVELFLLRPHDLLNSARNMNTNQLGWLVVQGRSREHSFLMYLVRIVCDALNWPYHQAHCLNDALRFLQDQDDSMANYTATTAT